MSHGWRSILRGRDLLANNLGWVVGNGQSIHVWQDPWLSVNKQERPIGPPCEHYVELKVSDLMLPETCEWDLHKLQLCLPDYKDSIQCIKPSQTGAPDKIVWLGTKTGEYTTKSGYYNAVNGEDNGHAGPVGDDFNWKKNVWNLECAPKIKMFSWKLLKGALPVGARLHERHVPVDPACKRCGEVESITHLFFHCRFARKVWQLAPFATEVDCSGMIDLAEEWLPICVKKCLPPSGISSGSLAPWILWSLWKERNKFVFEGHSASPEDTLSKALVIAREWCTTKERNTLSKSIRITIPVQLPPLTVTIRSDAAWAPGGTTAGLGCFVISPSESHSFSKGVSHVTSALMAEGLAMLEAVKLGAKEELRKICFESDSSQLISAINSGTCCPELYGVVADILAFSTIFEFVTFAWIARERNIQADRLAKAALNVSVPQVVDGVVIAPN
ncbi:uncharacterized protein LOC125608233 [Brassica napus]|uniref:uncharacterized protein LOC125608233 n=1 Tax=Brassica napus TaxID=3708 RepID=UPI002078C621|nr:uncharacterized protein LOC125608233 [Brassica napus]